MQVLVVQSAELHAGLQHVALQLATLELLEELLLACWGTQVVALKARANIQSLPRCAGPTSASLQSGRWAHPAA